MERRDWQVAAGTAVLAGVYFAFGKLGLSLATIHPSASAVWAPTGISIAALLVFGARLWPGVFVGAFLVNVTTNGTWAAALGIATGNTLEAVAATFLVNRYANGRHAFERSTDVFRFVGLAALASPALGATIGVTTLALAEGAVRANFGPIWATWWLGDASAAVVLAPGLILWTNRTPLRRDAPMVLESLAMGFTLFGVGLVVFGFGRYAPAWDGLPLAYLFIPVFCWTAFRLGPRGTSAAILGTSLMAIAGTLYGHGPYAVSAGSGSFLVLQGFMAVTAATMLALAAAVQERRKGEAVRLDSIRQVHEIEQLQRMNEFRTRFLNMAAHELRTPLAPIRAELSLLQTEGPGADAQSRQVSLDILGRNVERLSLLVEDVLYAARVQAGRMGIDRHAVDLDGVLAETVTSFRSVAKAAQVEMTYHPEHKPIVQGDPVRLAQVAQNLLGNAIKFTPPGGTVNVTLDGGPQEAVVRFADTGCGIKGEDIGRLFQPFARAPTGGKRVTPGTGLGLYISKALVELHGGRIWCESPGPDQGSTFSFALPIEGAIAGTSPMLG